MAKPKSKLQTDDEFAKTWVLYDELAPRRKTNLDSTTVELEALTVQEVEEILGTDDEAPTAIQPILKSQLPPK